MSIRQKHQLFNRNIANLYNETGDIILTSVLTYLYNNRNLSHTVMTLRNSFLTSLCIFYFKNVYFNYCSLGNRITVVNCVQVSSIDAQIPTIRYWHAGNIPILILCPFHSNCLISFQFSFPPITFSIVS